MQLIINNKFKVANKYLNLFFKIRRKIQIIDLTKITIQNSLLGAGKLVQIGAQLYHLAQEVIMLPETIICQSLIKMFKILIKVPK